MSGWSNEETISFLECYQSESCIWNPKDINHKDKKKVADAWSRLAELMQKPVKEVKAKKEILMTTFRKHLKKKQESFRSGAGAGDIYKPVWFAYETMETFLLPIYTCNVGINTETQSQQDTVPEETEDAEDAFLLRDHTDTVTTPSLPSTSTQKSRPRPASEMAEKQMAVAFEQLTNVLGKRQSERRPAPEDDDCDLYSKLLAKKLRELPNDERKIIMYQIDGLFINRINQSSFIRHTPSPQYYCRPSSVPSAFIPSRPSSVNTVYSEPILNTQNRPSPTLRSFPSPYTQTSHSEPISNIVIEHLSVPSTKHSHSINIISDQVIQPASSSSEPNILNAALLKTFEDYESFNP